MKKYFCKVKSPSRVDLSGGTLDCWPLYLYFLPVSTVNASINIYTQVELVLQKTKITIELPDLNKKYSFASVKECLKSKDRHLSLLQAQLEFWKPKSDVYFKIIIKSDSPIGAGLGSSSSLCVSFAKVFQDFAKNNFCTKPVKDILKNNEFSTNQIVNLSSNLEAKVLKMPTGTQDYFPAINSGLHIIDYSQMGFTDNILNAKYLDNLEKHLSLVYTGQPHNSGISNWKVIKDYLDGSKNLSLVLKGLSDVSKEMKNLFQNLEKNQAKTQAQTKTQTQTKNLEKTKTQIQTQSKIFEQIPQLFAKELSLRKKLNSSFITTEIENLRGLALKFGGKEIKVCGAGSGGCVLVWVDPEKKLSLQKNLKKHKYKVLDFNFVNKK